MSTEPMKTLIDPPGDGYFGIALKEGVMMVLSPCCSAVITSSDENSHWCIECATWVASPTPRTEAFTPKVNLSYYRKTGPTDFSVWAKYWTGIENISCILDWVD